MMSQSPSCLRSYQMKLGFHKVCSIFLIVTFGLTAWMRLIRQAFPDLPPTITPAHYQGVIAETNPWLEPWQRWDTLHYQAIAERGYTAFETAYFTPPLFPYLMRWAAPLFRGNTLAAGLFISRLAFFGCLLTLYTLARLELGSEVAAMRAVIYLASFPSSIFLVAAYNESLFLLGAVLCLYLARKEHWLAAGLAAGFAALARIPGILLIIPLAYMIWQAWHRGNRRGWLALAEMGLLVVGWYTYLWFALGEPPTVVLEAQQQRGGYLTLPGLNILEAARRITSGTLVFENMLELSYTLVFTFLTILIWRKLPRPYGLYTGTLMFFFLSRMGSPQPLVSMARYCLEIFPAFLLLAGWKAHPKIHRLILYFFWLGLLFFAAEFAIWGWIG